MTRTSLTLKSQEDRARSLDIELELDRERRVVTLHMLEFEADLVASFIAQRLPFDYGVRVDDSLFEHVLTPPRYGLFITLAGRHHPARLADLSDGRVAIRLLDPDAAYLAKRQSAIEQLLSTLSSRGIEGVVAGMDRHGRPEPSEGFLHLFLRPEDDAQEDYVHQLCRETGQEHGVDIVLLRSSRLYGDTDGFIAHESHFAWDAAERQVVRRNWSQV